MKELLLKNIIALIPIITLSVISLSLIIYKAIYFYSIRIKSQKKINKSLNELLKGDYIKALKTIEDDKSPTADILRYECKLLGEGNREVFSHKVEAFGQRKIFEMEKFVPYLSSIANVATLLGLLGTVIGMIFTFYDMMISESSDPYTLAGGISQALITTAAGLITAVPAILFYSIYISIIKRHISSMESSSSEILAAKES
ncbi:MotA/TolQ/ExbB proton channel family protein [Thiospirochaeta perfilievii]|uniref:MotA/TolQ/ExbB proton channel family protein n=1 Tax=Thiospirochaeta perfilievii TaxID=252967 RepID=A0A5C1Q771_9SPIO|nr:MotA/TolQ/ExbB proton channel family protein [Thiospirochaeta perfilievii]QEN03271.1 MotA/TolQ/ExbB proton channel family protein [Thiospirochaeta perfilievii]